jgi:phosphotriesterase-related protein
MNRRAFLATLTAAACARTRTQPLRDWILVHEHVLVDFGGAAVASRSRYDADEVFRTARPHLEALARLGCRRLQECTPNFLGRDPLLLRRLSDATGIELWTNTGLYAALDHKYLPEYARHEGAEQLAKRWILEAQQGVEGMKPRFIKIGVNRAPLHPLDRKIVEAAALASRETGLSIAAHTEDGATALEEIEILERARVDPAKFVWVHAQAEGDQSLHAQAARKGAWVELDGISPKTADWHLRCVTTLAEQGFLGRTLISQDAGWYHVGEPGGGTYRPYTYLFTEFVPRLQPEWRQPLLVSNPVKAFES